MGLYSGEITLENKFATEILRCLFFGGGGEGYFLGEGDYYYDTQFFCNFDEYFPTI